MVVLLAEVVKGVHGRVGNVIKGAKTLGGVASHMAWAQVKVVHRSVESSGSIRESGVFMQIESGEGTEVEVEDILEGSCDVSEGGR